MATKKLSIALAELSQKNEPKSDDSLILSTTDGEAQRLPVSILTPPTAQSSTQGSSNNYVYSSESDDTRCVLSSKMWLYTHKDGNLFLRFKHWGAQNDTNQTNYSQVIITGYVTRDKWGLMDPWMYARLNNHNLKEGLSTLDEVKVNYTRFDASGDKVLTLTKATSAKAGVMTAQDKTNLDNLTAYARDLGNFESEEAALDALKDIEISSNSNIVHVHCTYANGAMSITMMQNVENDYTRQIIFNKSKVFQRAIYFTDGTRQEISHAEDWSCLFGDRLQWDSGENKYVLRQFDLSFNKEHTDPIPTATANNDGLMSAADKQLLEQIKTKLGL